MNVDVGITLLQPSQTRSFLDHGDDVRNVCTGPANAFNNGFVLIECPDLVDTLKTAHSDDEDLTIRSGRHARVDFVKACIEVAERSYAFAPLGKVAQELVAKGGFEAVVRDQIAKLDG